MLFFGVLLTVRMACYLLCVSENTTQQPQSAADKLSRIRDYCGEPSCRCASDVISRTADPELRVVVDHDELAEAGAVVVAQCLAVTKRLYM
jgi:hypothetical protein